MRLWLVRHAMPIAAEGLCYGASDLEADPAATQQAAAALATSVPRGLAARCSPLQRCRQLAVALQQLRPDLTWQDDARLAELDFGCWEGQRWSAIAQEEYARWTADFALYRFGGRENVAELMARVASALAEARRSGRDGLWVTHGGVARALHLLVAGQGVPRTAADWPREGLGFGEARVFTVTDA
ncbi:alpha-ribazole phosphatase [Ramlibacter monticola]|uniref:Histidine phosphatase family protein n=1 Tax=Ramlibacter monticola TaxID=1926872 RepID=A0A936Z423_9BURK|nr:histidine phosphatase family protein [Ramlibacter monticola]MBL0393741.1 histidine phosphatase family protein [Ramlibacter monticola]